MADKSFLWIKCGVCMRDKHKHIVKTQFIQQQQQHREEDDEEGEGQKKSAWGCVCVLLEAFTLFTLNNFLKSYFCAMLLVTFLFSM